MARYIIREANKEDIPGITLLRQTITEFRSVSSEEYESFWGSLIMGSPSSTQQVLVAVNDRGDIVAHYAMVPFRFLKDGTPLVGGFLCQLMVRDDFRKELIFPKMEMKFLKEYKKHGYDFVFSLGNREQVVKAHLSFGFTRIGELPVYARPYKLSGIAQRIIKNRAICAAIRPGLLAAESFLRSGRAKGKGDITVAEIPQFDEGIDRFLSEVRKNFQFSALRNSEILNWRFTASTAAKYQILAIKEMGNLIGYAVLRRMEMNRFDVLAIVDILFPPERMEAGRTLLNAVHDKAIGMGVEMSACMLNSHDPLCPVLRKSGYYKTPETFSLFVHEPKNAVHHFSEATFDKWHLTWFDNDAV